MSISWGNVFRSVGSTMYTNSQRVESALIALVRCENSLKVGESSVASVIVTYYLHTNALMANTAPDWTPPAAAGSEYYGWSGSCIDRVII